MGLYSIKRKIKEEDKQEPKSPAMAMANLVVGLLGIVVLPFIGQISGIIISIFYMQCKRSDLRQQGRIALIFSIVFLALWIVFFTIVNPWLKNHGFSYLNMG
jgi:hypothetical protein